MGSSLSPPLANIVMEHIEETALLTFPHQVILWKRYVDDTFVVINNNFVDEFHEHLNSIHPDIQFTMEKARNNALPFLDVLIEKTPEGSVKTSVYRKPTHTDQYLHYNSYQPIQHKAAVVKTLVHRAKTIPNNENSRQQEITHIKESLLNNGYPASFINKHSQESQPTERNDDY